MTTTKVRITIPAKVRSDGHMMEGKVKRETDTMIYVTPTKGAEYDSAMKSGLSKAPLVAVPKDSTIYPFATIKSI